MAMCLLRGVLLVVSSLLAGVFHVRDATGAMGECKQTHGTYFESHCGTNLHRQLRGV